MSFVLVPIQAGICYLQPVMGIKVFLITLAQLLPTDRSERTAGLAVLGVNSLVARSWRGRGWGAGKGRSRQVERGGSEGLVAIYQSVLKYFSVIRTGTVVPMQLG